MKEINSAFSQVTDIIETAKKNIINGWGMMKIK